MGWGAGLIDGDRNHLIVFFSGAQPLRKSFHFLDYAERFPQTKLFIRDDSPNQFRTGIPGVTENEEENVAFFRYLIGRIAPSRVTFVTGSVGTHPAILWGHRLGVDDIHAVVPVTDLDSGLQTQRAASGTFAEHARVAGQAVASGYPYANLRPFMESNSGKVKSVDLYYGLSDPADVQQAANIEDLPQVRSTIYYHGTHNRVPLMVMRRDRELYDRINAPHIERPAELRRKGDVQDVELGYGVCRVVKRDAKLTPTPVGV